MKVLFFAPHSAVWIHAFPEALIAETLKQGGHEIVYVGCGGLLESHCISMIAYRVAFEAARTEKARICSLCKKNKEIIRARFGLGGVDLTNVVNDADISCADELTSSVTPQNCLDLMLDGVEVGKIALYELLLQSKKSALNFTAEEWQRYLASLKNVIMVLRVAQRIISEARPDRVIVYNALYSVNRIVCRIAEMRGIPQYFLHAGHNLSNRLQTLLLARDHAYAHFQHLRDKWILLEERPCHASAMRSATDHFLELIKGRSMWAYSAAPGKGVNLRKFFNIQEGQKIICATMSSDDEILAGQIVGALPSSLRLLFPKQVDWIKALIHYVKDRSELSLIVRVHPREFPNKRENVLSEHAKMLKVVLSVLPDNVKVNWPTDNVSLYDLANVTDVFVNAWSSAGKEMAWLGLPVVLYSHDVTLYPSNLNYVGTSEAEYFQQIEWALREGWNPERIRRTYRWCAIEHKLSSLEISESFARSEVRSFLSKGIRKLMHRIVPFREQITDCRRKASRLASSEKINKIVIDGLNSVLDLDEKDDLVSLAEETASLKSEVHRLVNGLYGDKAGYRLSDSLAGKLRHFVNS